jgi:hypothetical protein
MSSVTSAWYASKSLVTPEHQEMPIVDEIDQGLQMAISRWLTAFWTL